MDKGVSSMKVLKQLFNGKGYIDGITIINLEGEILFTAKLNGKLSNQENSQHLVGQKFLEVFENLTPSNSSTYQAMELGVPLYVENQLLQTREQETIRITSLSLPIKSRGRVVGAVDLSVQVFPELPEELDTPESFRIGGLSMGGIQKLADRDLAYYCMDDIIAVDERMQQAKAYIPVVASCDLPVMIYGETGTGKELFAQSIHNASPRRSKPFISQNCAALPETLLESILFGTSKGAFTGAVENKGLFELADGGTLFLDEINSMPLHLQSKLLRVLQDGTFRSLGARKVRTVNVRIIAAINVEPLQALHEKQLRQDIYYRLSMMSIHIPPLRERKKDIGSFIHYYVSKHNVTFHKHVQRVAADLIQRLEQYSWPGNVRQLEQVIVYGMSRVEEDRSTLELRDIAEKLREMARTPEAGSPLQGDSAPQGGAQELQAPLGSQPLREAVQAYEREIICRALHEANGKLAKAASLLKIPRQTLQRKVKQYEITPDPERSWQ